MSYCQVHSFLLVAFYLVFGEMTSMAQTVQIKQQPVKYHKGQGY